MSTNSHASSNDATLSALNNLAEVTSSSIETLGEVHDQLALVERRRRRGWSWRRIFSQARTPNPLALVTCVAIELGRATAEFRRAIARALRSEGMTISDVGPILSVSRQRVSALLRPGRDRSAASTAREA
jgi:hypothetical protein